MSAVLPRLQHMLLQIYGAPAQDSVQDFLLSDAQRDALGLGRAQLAEELLLTHDADGAVGMGIYIADAVLQQLEADSPFIRVHAGNLAQLCLATEGVSHVTYLRWQSQRDRPISELELELQAELDKFAVCTLLLHAQGAPMQAAAGALGRALFVGWDLQPGLTAPQAARYVRASQGAWALLRRDVLHARGPRDAAGLMRLARTWSRWPLAQKLAA
jgi:hypothetical protein